VSSQFWCVIAGTSSGYIQIDRVVAVIIERIGYSN